MNMAVILKMQQMPKNYAEMVAKRIISEKVCFQGKSQYRGFRPGVGVQIEIEDHYRDELNDAFIITEVCYFGIRSNNIQTDEIPHYTNEFKAIS
jgi:hypothetical protein